LTGFNLEFELTNKVLLSGHNIVEVPINYDPRTYAEGKKITVADGFKIIMTMLRDRLGLSATLKKTADTAVKNSKTVTN
ncbi:MAG: hypothetical protein H6652_26250, partial [Ardenticatenaceae bacterium]|nr:hypothetical protein [Ardenticatenaceae bacterium]